jgi:hypothetical protein
MNLLDLARSALPKAPEAKYATGVPTHARACYRWRVSGSHCGVYEVCFLPEATFAEVSALYPGAVVLPLPD